VRGGLKGSTMSGSIWSEATATTRRGAVRVVSLILLAFSASASAHQMDGAGFLDGFVHPWLGADHLLAMVAVGLYAARAKGAVLRWALPLTFILAAGTALVAARGGWLVPGVEGAILMTLLVLGLLVGARWTLAPTLALSLVAVIGALHGYAHGSEIPPAQSAWWFGLGMMFATAVLHTCGVVLAVLLQGRGVWPSRLAGAGIFAFGLGAATF